MRKSFYKICFFVIAIAFLLVFNGSKTRAIEYIYEDGNVKENYNDIEVNSFLYDYKVTFSEEDGIVDGDLNLKDVMVYGGRSILLSVNHYNKWWPFTKDDDETIVYKYDSEKKNFDTIFASFDNEKGSIELQSAGLYKVVYRFEGKVIKVNYIYISLDIHFYSIEGDERYLSMPIFSKFNFRLMIEDGYDLRKNEYYYAFGESVSGLSYKSLDVFTLEEKEGTEKVNSIDRELTVSVTQKDETLANKKKYLFVKVVDTTGKETIIQSVDNYEIDSKIQANVYIVDIEGAVMDGEKVYKQGEVIYFKVLLNVPVTYTNLLYTVDGETYISLDDVSEPTYEIYFQHTVNSLVSFLGKFNLRSKNNVNAIVKNEGVNAALNVIVKSAFKVDVVNPIVNLEGEGDSAGKNGYYLNLDVDDDNLKEVKYYAKKCSVFEVDVCVEDFDDTNSGVLNIGDTPSSVIFVGDNFGNFNGDNVAVFVKAIDRAGNVTTFVKGGFVIDNVIVEDNDSNSIFVEETIAEEDLIVGKKLKVVFPLTYNVLNVGYTIANGSINSCDVLVEGTEFECLSVENYPLSVVLNVVVEDSYGNKEIFEKNFDFNLLKDEEFTVEGLSFNSYSDKVYDIEYKYSNSMRTDVGKIAFGSGVLDVLEDKLYLNNVPSITNLTKNLIYIDGEYRIELMNDIGNQFVLLTLEEVLEILLDDGEINRCAFEACNLDLYLEYEYQTNGVDQTRLIKIAYLDNSNNFYIENYKDLIEVSVGKELEKFAYKYRDNLNIEIDLIDIEKTIEIVFSDKQGNQKIVESIDTNVVGSYIVKESFIYNNVKSFPLTYKIDVVDKEAPNIKLNGKDRVVIEVGGSFDDPLIMVSDNYDEEVEIVVESSPLLDLNKSGKYEIKYWAIDSNGNVSKVVTRVIIVEERNNAMVYLLVGGIGLVTLLVITLGIVVEKRKNKKKKNKKEENLN